MVVNAAPFCSPGPVCLCVCVRLPGRCHSCRNGAHSLESPQCHTSNYCNSRANLWAKPKTLWTRGYPDIFCFPELQRMWSQPRWKNTVFLAVSLTVCCAYSGQWSVLWSWGLPSYISVTGRNFPTFWCEICMFVGNCGWQSNAVTKGVDFRFHFTCTLNSFHSVHFSASGAAKRGFRNPQFLSLNSSHFLTNHKSYRQTKITVTERRLL